VFIRAFIFYGQLARKFAQKFSQSGGFEKSQSLLG